MGSSTLRLLQPKTLHPVSLIMEGRAGLKPPPNVAPEPPLLIRASAGKAFIGVHVVPAELVEPRSKRMVKRAVERRSIVSGPYGMTCCCESGFPKC